MIDTYFNLKVSLVLKLYYPRNFHVPIVVLQAPLSKLAAVEKYAPNRFALIELLVLTLVLHLLRNISLIAFQRPLGLLRFSFDRF